MAVTTVQGNNVLQLLPPRDCNSDRIHRRLLHSEGARFPSKFSRRYTWGQVLIREQPPSSPLQWCLCKWQKYQTSRHNWFPEPCAWDRRTLKLKRRNPVVFFENINTWLAINNSCRMYCRISHMSSLCIKTKIFYLPPPPTHHNQTSKYLICPWYVMHNAVTLSALPSHIIFPRVSLSLHIHATPPKESSFLEDIGKRTEH